MREPLLEALNKRILIGDGAMGTLLYSYGIGRCFEDMNISNREQIMHVHEAYIHAGADIIQTNTYGANSIKLANYGLDDHAAALNKAAVQLAKEAAKDRVYVLGTIGGIRGVQNQSMSISTICSVFREQANALLEAGVDGLLLETYYDLEELAAVLTLARKQTTLPIIAHVSMQEAGVLVSGLPLATALERLESLGADVVGTNCRLGPFHMIEALKEVPLPKHAFLSAYPNGSLPDYREGKLYYEERPDYFQKCALEFRNEGVRLLGGCCGTTPSHIEAFKRGIAELPPLQKKMSIRKRTSITVHTTGGEEAAVYQKVRQKRSVFVEFDTPRHIDTSHFFKGVQALQGAGADAVTMADNSLASPRVSNAALAYLVKERFAIPPLVHVACRDRNLIGLQSHLLGLDVLGLRDLLVVTGDPTKIGDFPGASSVYDLSSMQLIELIKKKFNRGMSYSGKSLKKSTRFRVAAAFNPNVRNLDKAVQRMQRKIECGADYFISQPVFDPALIEEIYQATCQLSVPVYLGVMPLTSSRNAEFLHNEVPGIQLPEATRRRMAKAEAGGNAREEGLLIAKELLSRAVDRFPGIYLITPMGRYQSSVELLHYIRELAPPASTGESNSPLSAQ
ncbi:MAG: bifunctional homocysteine S-methyltransferase/methylenetetrahydrofolate reductase [Sporolactobacillus sp.]